MYDHSEYPHHTMITIACGSLSPPSPRYNNLRRLVPARSSRCLLLSDTHGFPAMLSQPRNRGPAVDGIGIGEARPASFSSPLFFCSDSSPRPASSKSTLRASAPASPIRFPARLRLSRTQSLLGVLSRSSPFETAAVAAVTTVDVAVASRSAEAMAIVPVSPMLFLWRSTLRTPASAGASATAPRSPIRLSRRFRRTSTPGLRRSSNCDCHCNHDRTGHGEGKNN